MSETQSNYNEYLDSFAWKAIKQVKLEQNSNCEVCGVKATSVHHLSYERLGKEKESDVVSICKECHNECHYVNGYQIKNSEKELRKRFNEMRDYNFSELLNKINGDLKEIESIKLSEYDTCDDPDINYFPDREEQTQEEYYKELDDEMNYLKYTEIFRLLLIKYYSNDLKKYFLNPIVKKIIEFYSFNLKFDDHKLVIKKYLSESDYNSLLDAVNYINITIASNKYDYIYYNLGGKFYDIVDLESYEILDGGLSKDCKNIYYYLNIDFEGSEDYCSYSINIKNIDIKTLEILNDYYFKDKNNAYYKGKIIELSDGKTFEVIKDNYFKDKNNVYYIDKVIEGVDTKTFEEINYNGLGYSYFKDKNNAYYEGKIIELSDGKTFEVINNEYSKDKNNAYYEGKIIEGSDGKTFEIINSKYSRGKYSRDKSNVYYNGIKILLLDIETFEIINENYIKDKKNSFYKGRILYVQKNNRLKFESIGACYKYDLDSGSCYYCDTINVYFRTDHSSEIIKYCNIETFEVIDNFYSKDINNAYYKGKVIEGADSKTFEVIDTNYSKDINNVYYEGKVIEGADSKTFEVIDTNYTNYSKDINNAYYEGKVIEGSDGVTFEVIDTIYSNNYSKDINNAYYEGKVIEGSDGKTFEIIHVSYSKDKNNIYYINYYRNMYVIEGSDIKTFEIIDNEYSKDKNNAYYEGKIIELSDGDTFEVIDDIYSKDKNNVYFNGKKMKN